MKANKLSVNIYIYIKRLAMLFTNPSGNRWIYIFFLAGNFFKRASFLTP